jgi:Rod binding domain-containing protein
MAPIGESSAAATLQLPGMLPPRSVTADGNSKAQELREQFTQFVGEVFYGQMIKAMRATTSKAAYFHGGRAEDVFQGQLDQKLAEHLTEASAERFAEPMFERQFPKLVQQSTSPQLDQLAHLRRS